MLLGCNHQIKNELAKESVAGRMQRDIGIVSKLRLNTRGVDLPHLKRRGLNQAVDNQRLRAEIEEGRS